MYLFKGTIFYIEHDPDGSLNDKLLKCNSIYGRNDFHNINGVKINNITNNNENRVNYQKINNYSRKMRLNRSIAFSSKTHTQHVVIIFKKIYLYPIDFCFFIFVFFLLLLFDAFCSKESLVFFLYVFLFSRRLNRISTKYEQRVANYMHF